MAKELCAHLRLRASGSAGAFRSESAAAGGEPSVSATGGGGMGEVMLKGIWEAGRAEEHEAYRVGEDSSAIG